MSNPLDGARTVAQQIRDDPQVKGVLAELVHDLAEAVEELAVLHYAHEAEHGYEVTKGEPDEQR